MSQRNPDPIPPNTISTPEGDNEFAPGELISPVADDAPQVPIGFDQNSTAPDNADDSNPKGLEKFIDEVARGEYM